MKTARWIVAALVLHAGVAACAAASVRAAFGFTDPSFAPDGRSLLAVARDCQAPRLARIQLAHPNRPHLLNTTFAGTAPAWAPATRHP
jgi:hypothetical protein